MTVSTFNVIEALTKFKANQIKAPIIIAGVSNNIAANFDKLNKYASKIQSIDLSDTTHSLLLNASQINNDSVLIKKINNTITVTDNYKNIQKTANLSALLNLGDKLTSLTETGPITSVTLTSKQYNNTFTSKFTNFKATVSDATETFFAKLALDKNVSDFSIKDNASNISDMLDALQKLGSKLTKITQTDKTRPIAVTVDQLKNDAGTLEKLSNKYTLTISDVTLNNLASVLNDRHVTSISISVNTTELTNNMNIFTKKSNHISEIILKDSTFHIAANFDLLKTLNNKLSGIIQTDPNSYLTITAEQLLNNANTIAKILTNYSLSVHDASLNNIKSFLTNSTINNALHADIYILDNSASINTNLDAIENYTNSNIINLKDISFTDTSAELIVSSTQFFDDSDALNLISGDYHLSVGGVNTDDIATVLKNSHVDSISISDTGDNIAYSINTLNTNIKLITTITITNPQTALELTSKQFFEDRALINLFRGSYNLSISDSLISDIPDTIKNSNVTLMTVTDYTSNITNNLDLLYALGNKLTEINQLDPDKPIEINASQFSKYTNFLNNTIQTNYSLNVLDVSTVNLNSIINNSNVNTITVYDSESNILKNIDNLENYIDQIISISFTNTNITPVTLTSDQFVNDVDALDKINALSLTVNTVAASDINYIAHKNYVNHISLVDTADQIGLYIDNLNNNLNKITSISISDYLDNTVTITANQLITDKTTLDLLKTKYTLAIINAPSNFSIPIAYTTHFKSNSFITVTDSSSAISSNLTSLNLLNSKCTDLTGMGISITQTDPETPLTITANELKNDSNVLNSLIQSNNATIFNIDLGSSKTSLTLDGANGHDNFIFHTNSTGTPSATNIATINNFNGQDKISFYETTSPTQLTPFSIEAGLASINTSSGTGIVSFNPTDDTLPKQIIAVEKAIALSNNLGAGHFAIWNNGSDSFLLITDLDPKTTSGDDLIKFVGMDVSHLQLSNGVISYT